MLGIVFVTIPQIGSQRHPTFSLGIFSIDQRIIFWGLVFLGDLIAVIPAGIIADRVGRKNLIVIGAYLIVVSMLNLGLSENIWMYLFSAYILGISFGLIHPAASVWCDLSPLDSIGRYMALNYLSLLQGVGVGLFLGLFVLQENVSTISYILIGVTVLALLPLFFVSDSYQPLDIFLLLLSINGMACFDYAFKVDKEVTQKDLSLVAGALSAISTFFETVDKQHATLDLVRHGNVYVVQTKTQIESGELVGTLFANKNDPELYRHLKDFVGNFCSKYSGPLKNWQGELLVFQGASDIAEEVFGPLLPSRTIG
jgi:MFS family permease